jgi:diguanylate cyclase (GGDEF)-like protein
MYARNDSFPDSAPVVEPPAAERLDPVTGCLSCSAFTSEATAAFDRARAGHTPFSVLALEIVRFEEVPLRYGSDAGKDALEVFARKLNDNIRGLDGLCRVDGGKFTITLASEGLDCAVKVAQRLLSATRTKTAPLDDATLAILKMPLSIGVAVLQPSDATLVHLLARAYRARDRAKSAGANRIEVDR